MRITRISFCAALLIVAAVQCASGPRVHAAVQNKNTAGKLLVSGPWQISGDGMSSVLTFLQNGTFTTDDVLDLPGRWSIADDTITLAFSDGHIDFLKLPLNPKGTAGTDQSRPIAFVLVSEIGANTASAPVPAPDVSRPASPASTSPPAPAPAARTQPADATVALLISGPWKLSKQGGSAVRIFKQDGTFTTIDKTGENGRWAMTKDSILLTFPNGHEDALTLPLNPKGTEGMADDGSALSAIRLNSTAVNNAPASKQPPDDGGMHYFGTQYPPAQ